MKLKKFKFKKIKQETVVLFLIAFFVGMAANNMMSSHLIHKKVKIKNFPIEMSVDFGPANKPNFHETITIEHGTTPKEAVSQVFPLLSGVSCCSYRDVIEIGGVRSDPAQKKWWICTVNGSKNISPHKKILSSGDVVKWSFIEDTEKEYRFSLKESHFLASSKTNNEA